MIIRLFWLGVIETERGENYPHFFKVDLIPPIWRFLRRDEGGCDASGELMNGADYCTVHFWFASLLTLLLAVDSMSSKRHIMRKLPGDASGEFWVRPDDYSPTLLVLAICVAVLIFCLHSSHVLWPSRFKSKCHSMVSIVVAMARAVRMLIICRPFPPNWCFQLGYIRDNCIAIGSSKCS